MHIIVLVLVAIGFAFYVIPWIIGGAIIGICLGIYSGKLLADNSEKELIAQQRKAGHGSEVALFVMVVFYLIPIGAVVGSIIGAIIMFIL